MLPIRTLTVFISFFLLSSTALAQEKYPATLLWKISGKGLSQPSYLYGTMHVQDRRLFYFGDSLYSALERTEGFAIEVNPDEMMDSIFRSLGKKDTSALLKKILNEAEYKKIAKKLEKKLKVPADKITVKKLAEERKRLQKDVSRKDDMPTIMDLYLFSLARKQGKYVGGIEDVADQFEVADEMGNFKIEDFIEDDSTVRISYLEEMKKVYLNRDLASVDRMVNTSMQNEFRNLLLIKRNIKMALRIDSLSNVRSSFFAIGTAHLPGDSGVISLLKQKGYTVEPVFSSTFIAPEKYKYTVKETAWLKIEDENKMCSVLMPGTPTAMLAQEIVPMKMYMDMAEMSVYGVAVTPLTEEEVKSETFFDRYVDVYKKMAFDVKRVKNIEYKNCKGIEMYAVQNEEIEFRFRLILKENKLFIVIFGGKDEAKLYDANAEKFFGSLSFNEENIAGKNQWQLFTNEKNAFSLMAPGKIIEGLEYDDEGFGYDKYTSVDYSDGIYYMLLVRDTRPGYFIESDSLYFEEYKKNLALLTGDNIKEFSRVTLKNYNACRFSAVQVVENHEMLIEGYLVRRGNRTYVPMVVLPKEKADFPQITNFFRSFTPLPFKNSEWSKHSPGNSNVSTSAPGPFIKVVEDTLGYAYNKKVNRYNVQDKNSAASYAAETEYFSPWYWSKNDSSFFKRIVDNSTGYNDTLLSYTHSAGPFKSADAVIKLKSAPVYKKFRYILNGDTLYTFYVFQSEEELSSEQTKKYFSDISFEKKYPSSVFSSKAAGLLQALNSNDSAVVAEARDVLAKVEFAKEDLPLLFGALQKKYRKYADDYRTINELLEEKIISLNDSSVVAFVDKQYRVKNNPADSAADIQMLLLELLAHHKTASSYQLLKELLLKTPPREGTSYSIVNAVTDTLELVKDFFPAAAVLYADTVVGGGIAKLANELLDSNLVKTADILQNESGLLALANRQYEELKKDKDSYPVYNSEVITLSGRFNTKESNAVLTKYLGLPEMWVKNNALLALLKNDQPVPASEIRKFAADKDWRTSFYESLRKINKTLLFPQEFYSQSKFAESYLYTSLTGDYEVDVKSMQFVKEKTAEINGKTKRFYLYKVLLDYDEDKVPRFAVCGPFEMDKNIAAIKEADLDVYMNYDEEYSLKTIDEMFSKYLDAMQERIKNRE